MYLFISLNVVHNYSVLVCWILRGPEILSYAHPLVNRLSELWAQSTLTSHANHETGTLTMFASILVISAHTECAKPSVHSSVFCSMFYIATLVYQVFFHRQDLKNDQFVSVWHHCTSIPWVPIHTMDDQLHYSSRNMVGHVVICFWKLLLPMFQPYAEKQKNNKL